MDHETRKEIAALKARVKELEARLAISGMPDEASALIADLGLEVETREEEERLDIFMIEEFIKLLGYQTRTEKRSNLIFFTDMFKDYHLVLREDKSIKLSMLEPLDSDIDFNMLTQLDFTQDLGIELSLNKDSSEVEFSVYSVALDVDSYREAIRFFLGLLNEKADKLYSYYFRAKSVRYGTDIKTQCS